MLYLANEKMKIALWLALSELVAWEKYYGLLSYLEVESQSSELDNDIPKLWIVLAEEDFQPHFLCCHIAWNI